MFVENWRLTIFLFLSFFLALVCSSVSYHKTSEEQRTSTRKTALAFVVIFMALAIGAVSMEALHVHMPLVSCSSVWSVLAVLSAVCTYHVYDGMSAANRGDKFSLFLVVMSMLFHMILLAETSCKSGGVKDSTIHQVPSTVKDIVSHLTITNHDGTDHETLIIKKSL